MSGVQLTKLVKRYGDLEVVKAIDLEVNPHEFVVLVGPSGCGKSTALRMIAGLEEISGGTVTISDPSCCSVCTVPRRRATTHI